MEVREGYKRTEVGVIPEDWGVAAVGDAFDVCDELRRPISATVRERMVGMYPYYGPTSIQGYINEYRVEGEYALIGEDGDHFLKWKSQPMTQLVAGRFNVNNHAHLVRGRASTTRWFYHYFRHRDLAAFLTRQGAGRFKLTKGTLSQIPCAVPGSHTEQEAIAEALSDADALIESLEQLLAKKRQIKQGAMQELLTGKRRLRGFGGDWNEQRMADMGATFGGLTGMTKRDFGHGECRYIPFMSIISSATIDSERLERVDVRRAQSQNRVVKGDLFFNGSSETPDEVGLCSLLVDEIHDVFLNSFCFGFRLRTDAAATGIFLTHLFRSNVGRDLLRSLAQGATRYNLSKRAFLNLRVPVPTVREQSAIATVLSDMDAEISPLESKLAKVRDLKQGMMQELLTGRIRLV